MSAMLRLVRALLGLSAPFCRRWGHDIVRGCGPGREYAPMWLCADPECGWYGDRLPTDGPVGRETGR